MIEVGIFTVVVAGPEAPSVVVLTEKTLIQNILGKNSSDADVPFKDHSSSRTLETFDVSAAFSLSYLFENSKPAENPDLFSKEASDESELASSVFGKDAFNTNELNSSDHNTGEFKKSPLEPLLLPIWIGHSEAEAILLLLDKQSHARPLTHDLLASVIGSLGSKVERVVIDKVIGSTFFANICINKDGRKINLDARPSDSIALALRTGARIFVDEDVMNAAGHRFMVKVTDGGELLYGSTEDEVEEFHSFIESVSPEDFKL